MLEEIGPSPHGLLLIFQIRLILGTFLQESKFNRICLRYIQRDIFHIKYLTICYA